MIAAPGGMAATTIVKPRFAEDKDPQKDKKCELLFFAYFAGKSDGLDEHTVAGFTRVYEDKEEGMLIGNSLQDETSLREDQQEAVVCALFHAVQEIGKAFAQDILLDKQAVAEAAQKPLENSFVFVRSMFGASDFMKKFVLEQSFNGKQFERLEMIKRLSDMSSHDDDLELPDGIEVTTLDLTDVGRLCRVYSVLSMDEPVSVICLERIADGEGGGDEVSLIFAAHIKVVSEKKDADEPVPEVSVPAFPADFEERKQKITQNATTAYVCEVATLPAYCGKGLAGNLLQRSFLAAKEVSLEKVTLGTDGINAKAMRAYSKAGMVETKSAPSPRGTVAKEVLFRHPYGGLIELKLPCWCPS